MRYPIKPLLFLLACCLACNPVCCQQAGNWFFGNRAGLSFNGGPPLVTADGALNTIEGCASISDDTGQLLFYTDGISVWNRQHRPMPNGTGLKGHTSAANSAIIVPKPGSPAIYYIFTADAIENNNASGYNFSELDMTLDGGLGDITANKNILLYAPSTEKLTATRHANGIDVWVITKDWGNNTWRVFKVDCNGVHTNPVISNAGAVHDELFMGLHVGSSGLIKVSPDGTLLSSTRPNANTWELFHFDNATGIISDALSFATPSVYGAEFSSDSKLLYIGSISGINNIDQYDVSVYNKAAIQASAIPIGVALASSGALQMGPDNKIYCARSHSRKLGVINAPGVRGPGCNYADMQVDVQQAFVFYGLPAFISDLVINPRADFSYAPANNRCATVNFTGSTRLSGPLTWQWDFGDGTTGAGQTTTHTYASGDSVWVKLTLTATGICGGSITSTKKIPVPSQQAIADFSNTPPCLNTQITFTDASSVDNISSWSWDFGDGTNSRLPNPVHRFTATGTYHIKYGVISATGCTAHTTKDITIVQVNVRAGHDTIVAIGQALQLQAGGAAAYTWSPATWLDDPLSAGPVARPGNDIVYYLRGITTEGCIGYDSLHIKVYKGPAIYVPTAFSPNGDAANDLLRPIVPGIKKLDYFSVYNRAGQLMFSTATPGKGWDGRFNGMPQPPGAYAWIIQVQDYLGHTQRQKGMVMLLR